MTTLSVALVILLRALVFLTGAYVLATTVQTIFMLLK